MWGFYGQPEEVAQRLEGLEQVANLLMVTLQELIQETDTQLQPGEPKRPISPSQGLHEGSREPPLPQVPPSSLLSMHLTLLYVRHCCPANN